MTSKNTQSATPHKINITPVILAGGKGLRLRPLTSDNRPKHLLKFCSKYSFLQRTLLRVSNMNPPIILCEERHRKATQKQLTAIGCDTARIIAEPEGKSTAIAIALAANLAKNDTLLILPCDHAIKNADQFEHTIATIGAVDLSDKLILFGAPITKPATRYGYIRQSNQHPILNKVTNFTEKPNKDTAKTLKKSGEYLWNTGIFLTTAQHILKEIQRFHPEITHAVQNTNTHLEGNIITLNQNAFKALPNISIDHALMENTQTAYVTNLGLKWADTGTWRALIFSKFGLF